MNERFTIKLRIGLGAICGIAAAAISFASWERPIEELSIDWRLRLRPQSPISNDVRLVGIGDRDVGQALGRWPFPRAVHADVLSILRAAGMRHCAMDILFSEPSGDAAQDQKLKDVVENRKDITLAYYFEDTGGASTNEGTEGSFVTGNRYGLDVSRFSFVEGRTPAPLFARIVAAYGAVNAVPDSDGKIRRTPLFFAHDGKLYPSLAMQAVMSTLEVEMDQVRIEPGRAVTLVGTPRGTLRIPVDEHCQYRVNFAGGIGVFAPAFQYVDLYAAAQSGAGAREVWPQLRGRTVFIGNVSTGNTDVVNTPVGLLPGIAVQATVASNILTGQYLRELPPWLGALLTIALCMAVGALLRARAGWINGALIVLCLAAWSAIVCALAIFDVLLPFVSVTCGILATGLTVLAFQVASLADSRDSLVEQLGKYMSNVLRKSILESPGSSITGSRRSELTVFFSDIRGFTQWTERADPDELTLVLNEYFASMTQIVEQHGGILDKLMGDCIMVFFGAPVVMPDHALRAAKMAWEMQREIDKLNARWVSEGREALRVGMGINTSFMTVGNFGSKDFMDFTVIGQGVNLAARIESWAPGGVILLSTKTRTLVGGAIRTRLFAELRLKGVAEFVEVFEVLGFVGSEKEAPPSTAPEYWFAEDGKEFGPFPLAGVEVMRRCGRIDASTPLRSLEPAK